MKLHLVDDGVFWMLALSVAKYEGGILRAWAISLKKEVGQRFFDNSCLDEAKHLSQNEVCPSRQAWVVVVKRCLTQRSNESASARQIIR